MQHRAVSGIEGLHFRRVLETFTENRTDMALVRIVTPVRNGSIADATQSAIEFVQAAYPDIMRQFPARSN